MNSEAMMFATKICIAVIFSESGDAIQMMSHDELMIWKKIENRIRFYYFIKFKLYQYFVVFCVCSKWDTNIKTRGTEQKKS